MDKLQQAISKILRPDQSAFYKTHQQNWPNWSTDTPPEQWEPTVFSYPKLTLLSVAHSFAPKSRMIEQTQRRIVDFLHDRSTNNDQKLIMVEGRQGKLDEWLPTDNPTLQLTNVIRRGGESAMTLLLAQRANIACLSPEVTTDRYKRQKLNEELIKQYDGRDIALYRLLLDLPGIDREKMLWPSRLARLIHDESNQWNLKWTRQINANDEELFSNPDINVRRIHQDKVTEEILSGPALDWINNRTQALIGMPLIKRQGDQILLPDTQLLARLTDPTIFRDTQHPYASSLNDISRIVNSARDDFLVTSIYQAHQNNKDILVVFGGSHILAIKPAIDFLMTPA